MAVHAGFGLSKAALLVGAGFTGSILVRNGKLSDLLAELQTLLKSTEESDSDSADSVAAQVSRLAMEIRQLASARSITVLNGGSGEGNMTSFWCQRQHLGAIGYGYMWWKATKRHLTQRIEGLDGKLDEQKLVSTEIRDEVSQVRGKIENISFDLGSIQQIVYGMDGKMTTIERKQGFAKIKSRYPNHIGTSKTLGGEDVQDVQELGPSMMVASSHRQVIGGNALDQWIF
ncbi:hypothetical protein HPP92_021412 [Vanilla planifolia]|uniref:DUF1664 domain-containing protein n=1 Tax=Vanilla planifolia TaxID=51239 RepID=A0A835PYM9_VANPL|nr:hypothetical protein HPP92_021412 [Vanilla planifolia]